jgi:hypothetical protein
MSSDNIKTIGIDESGRLYIVPEQEEFTMIYRSAAEVHWDNKGKYLFSPKPREWSYFDWYRQIVLVVKDEYGCQLRITDQTTWSSIPSDLKIDIESFKF